MQAKIKEKHQIHRWPVNSPHKGPVTRKMLPFDVAIMYSKWQVFLWYMYFCYYKLTSKIVTTHGPQYPLSLAEDLLWSNRISSHCGLAKPYGSIDLGQHWLGKWIVASRHQAIPWINFHLSSVRTSDIHLRAISQVLAQPPIVKISIKLFI